MSFVSDSDLCTDKCRQSVECKCLTSEASGEGAVWSGAYVLTPANQYGEWMPGANAIMDKGRRLKMFPGVFPAWGVL